MGRGVLHRQRGRVRPHALPLAALVAPILLLGGCGGTEDSAGNSEMCANYDEIVATAEEFGDMDATATSADELRSRAQDFRDRLDELQEVAEGERIDSALSSLETSLDSARDTAAEAGVKVDERVAQAEDSLEEVNEKWARVQALVTDRCD